MKAEFGKFGPAHDYRGAFANKPDGTIVQIADIYYKDHGCTGFVARLRRNDGTDAGECYLRQLEIMKITYNNA